MRAYVDVRYVHPIYVYYQYAVLLVGAPRSITVSEAAVLAHALTDQLPQPEPTVK